MAPCYLLPDCNKGAGVVKQISGETLLDRSAADQDGKELDLLALINAVWRGKWIIAACIALGIAAGWYEATKVAVPMYRATAQMALQLRNEPVVNLETVISGVSGDEYSMNTEMEIIRSRELISRLVDELDLVNDPEFNPMLAEPRPISLTAIPRAAIGSVRQIVDRVLGDAPPGAGWTPTEDEIYRSVVSNVRGAIEARTGDWSYVFWISATSESPQKSAEMANTLARIYRDDQIQLKVQATENAAEWLSVRVSALAAELEERQSAAADLQSRNALVSEEGLQAVNTQAIELRQRLEIARAQASRANDRLVDIIAAQGADIATRAQAAGDGQLEAIAQAALAGDAAARVRFDRRFDQITLQVRAEADRAAAQVAELDAALADLSRQFEMQSNDLLALQQLERETEATRVLYETFLTRLKETTVQQGVHQADSRILSEATPGTQVAPRKLRIVAVTMILGLLIGAGIVILRELLQNTYRSSDDLEAGTGLSVLGQVPVIPTKSRTDSIAYLRGKPTSAPAEAIRDLRTSVLLSNLDKPPKVIMFTSSVPSEGKTTLSIALAQNLAGLDKRVLLVEGDIRRRTFDAYFTDAGSGGGLISVVSGKMSLAEAVFHSDEMGVDILRGEKTSVNAADLFSSERFGAVLQEMRDAYDFVIIDTPPVLIVPDARVIAQMSDAVLYAVHWDKTSKSQVAEGLRLFRSVNVQIAGMVLSKVNPAGMRRYGYGDKYGAYSRYGRSYYEA